MNITNINIYAEGYYSGCEHEENIAIRTEIYEKLKAEIDNIKCYIGGLDGKHSEVEADTTIDSYTEEEIVDTEWDIDDDTGTLYYHLEEIFENNKLNLNDEIKIVKDYIDSLDTYVEIEVSVRKSNVEKVYDYCKNL